MCDRMVVGFTTSYAISAYHYWSCELESRSGRGVQHYVIKVCQKHATSQCFSPGTPVSSTNKTDCHDISEILLKVTLNITTLTLFLSCWNDVQIVTRMEQFQSYWRCLY